MATYFPCSPRPAHTPYLIPVDSPRRGDAAEDGLQLGRDGDERVKSKETLPRCLARPRRARDSNCARDVVEDAEICRVEVNLAEHALLAV